MKVIDGVSNLEFNYSENTEAARAATVTVTASDGTIEASVELSISQLGGIVDATAADINAAEDGPAEYRLTGYISEDTGSEYGNIYIKDYTGEVYVYGVLDENGESKQWANMGIKAGDIITVVVPSLHTTEIPGSRMSPSRTTRLLPMRPFQSSSRLKSPRMYGTA